ncbi:MAG: hypothetical protein AAFP76_15180 [Bacteroidota bacterium]
MKPFIFLLLISIFPAVAGAQVGIGTTSPDASSVLDITSTDKGILIPRMTTGERNAISNPANGLMIYNTDSDELQLNSNNPAAPFWEALSLSPTATSTPGDSMKYSNTDITTNVNAGALNLPIFGTLVWNDNPALYTVSGNQVTIADVGRYEIVVNVSLLNSTAADRNAPEIRIFVNGSAVGSYGSTGYIRSNNGHEESSLHLREIIEVPASAVITIVIAQSANTSAVTMRSAGTSNIYIEKIL